MFIDYGGRSLCDLILLIAQGDREALRTAYLRVSPRINTRLVVAFGAEVAEDMLVEIFVRVWIDAQSLDGQGFDAEVDDPDSWLDARVNEVMRAAARRH